MSVALAMRLALEAAWERQFLTYPNPAVGAAVVGSCGEIVAVAAHEEAGGPHAEVLAIRDAYVKLSGDGSLADCADAAKLHAYLLEKAGDMFRDKTIVVTLEPCNHHGRTPPCAGLIEALGFRRAVIGALDPVAGHGGGAERLKGAGVEVVVSTEKKACEALLEPFVKWQKGRFVFFKLAQTLNGVIDGGTISCEASRRWVHKVREKIDRLVIGGETVRIDRPRLDARLTGGPAPDVSILTRHPQWIDRDIPLFGVSGRRVDFVAELPEKGLVMVEGGAGTFAALREEIDWTVLFVAPFVKEGMGYNAPKHFELLYQRKMGRDSMLFLKALADG